MQAFPFVISGASRVRDLFCELSDFVLFDRSDWLRTIILAACFVLGLSMATAYIMILLVISASVFGFSVGYLFEVYGNIVVHTAEGRKDGWKRRRNIVILASAYIAIIIFASVIVAIQLIPYDVFLFRLLLMAVSISFSSFKGKKFYHYKPSSA